jgi:phospholipid/cholesterol/gamma-HCH transport system ATP-binding protein
MLALEHVEYTIGGKAILRDVSLNAPAKQTLAILGASGSGKSTILRVILGLAQPDRGAVRIGDKDITQIAYAELVEIRKRMGIVFQEGALFDSLTVGENVGYYFLEHERQTHSQVADRVLAMLAEVGLEHTVDMMPEQLSGGMRRRVAIARALIYQPDIILYDEPTTGLDPVAGASILELINRLKAEHQVTSVIVTHDLEDAAQVADNFVVIRQGEVAWQGSKKQFVAKQPQVVKTFYAVEA